MSYTPTPTELVHSNKEMLGEITNYMDIKTLFRYKNVSRLTLFVAKVKLPFTLIDAYMCYDINMFELDCCFYHYKQDVNYPIVLMYLLHKITISQAKKALSGTTDFQSRGLTMSICQWKRYNNTNVYAKDIWPMDEDHHRLVVFLFELGYCVDAIEIEITIIITCDGFNLVLNSSLINMMTAYIDNMLSDGMTLDKIRCELEPVKHCCGSIVGLLEHISWNSYPEEGEIVQVLEEIITVCRELWPDLPSNYDMMLMDESDD